MRSIVSSAPMFNPLYKNNNNNNNNNHNPKNSFLFVLLSIFLFNNAATAAAAATAASSPLISSSRQVTEDEVSLQVTESFSAQFHDSTSTNHNVLENKFYEQQAQGIIITNITDLPFDDDLCINNLNLADINTDQQLTRDEFLTFIQLQSECPPDTITDIPQSQLPFFVGLSCLCLSIPGSSFSCCAGDNARIDIPTTNQELEVICNLRYLSGTPFCGILPPQLRTSIPTTVNIIISDPPSMTPPLLSDDMIISSDKPSDSASDIASDITSDISSDNPSDQSSTISPTITRDITLESPTSSPSNIVSIGLSDFLSSNEIIPSASCSSNPVCAELQLLDDCCPTSDGTFLYCCENYDITTATDPPITLITNTPTTTSKPTTTTNLPSLRPTPTPIIPSTFIVPSSTVIPTTLVPTNIRGIFLPTTATTTRIPTTIPITPTTTNIPPIQSGSVSVPPTKTIFPSSMISISDSPTNIVSDIDSDFGSDIPTTSIILPPSSSDTSNVSIITNLPTSLNDNIEDFNTQRNDNGNDIDSVVTDSSYATTMTTSISMLFSLNSLILLSGIVYNLM